MNLLTGCRLRFLLGRNSSVPGKIGKAIKLTGDDAFGTKVGNFRRYQPFSISLWMKTPDVKERAVVFHRSRAWTDSGSRGYQLLIEEGKLSWSLIHFWPGNALRIKTKQQVVAISARLGIAPFIVTLGMMLVARGLAEGFADETVVRTPDNFLKTLMIREPNPKWLVFAYGVWVNVILFLLMVILMRFSVFGRRIYALGANEEAARYSGINVIRNRVLIFTLGGAMFGLAGVMSYAEIGDGDPTTAVALELDIIAAVVIGGASLAGGRGTVFGSMIGAIIITLLYNGCVMLRVDDWVQKVLIGGIIVAAVWVDGIRAKRT